MRSWDGHWAVWEKGERSGSSVGGSQKKGGRMLLIERVKKKKIKKRQRERERGERKGEKEREGNLGRERGKEGGGEEGGGEGSFLTFSIYLICKSDFLCVLLWFLNGTLAVSTSNGNLYFTLRV